MPTKNALPRCNLSEGCWRRRVIDGSTLEIKGQRIQQPILESIITLVLLKTCIEPKSENSMSSQDLEKILKDIEKDYQTEIVPITVSGRTLKCLRIADLDEIIFQRLATTDVDASELPFWGKIW